MEACAILFHMQHYLSAAVPDRYREAVWDLGNGTPGRTCMQVLDPSKSVVENLDALGYNHLDLPPELRPESFPGLLLMGADSPLFKFDNEV